MRDWCSSSHMEGLSLVMWRPNKLSRPSPGIRRCPSDKYAIHTLRLRHLEWDYQSVHFTWRKDVLLTVSKEPEWWQQEDFAKDELLIVAVERLCDCSVEMDVLRVNDESSVPVSCPKDGRMLLPRKQQNLFWLIPCMRALSLFLHWKQQDKEISRRIHCLAQCS